MLFQSHWQVIPLHEYIMTLALTDGKERFNVRHVLARLQGFKSCERLYVPGQPGHQIHRHEC